MRRERDSLGEKAVPDDALYGIFTERARGTFDLGGGAPHPAFLQAITLVKKAAARANRRLGLLPPRLAAAIEWAADRVIEAVASGGPRLEPSARESRRRRARGGARRARGERLRAEV